MTETTEAPSRRIADHLGEAIRRGEHAAGDKMPSERELAQRHNVTRATATRALKILRERGLIESRHGSGSYVRARPHEVWRNSPEHGRLFLGYQPRACGEHRTVGAHRAWCFDCGEWCYPGEDGSSGADSAACKGCTVHILAARLPS